MTTEWRWTALIITLNKDVGNILANMSRPFLSDENDELETFSGKRMLEPTAYYAVIHCKQDYVSVLQAIIDDAPFSSSALNDLKQRQPPLTEELWGIAKQNLFVAYRESITEDGTVTLDSGYFRNFINELNYTIIDPEL